MDINAILKQYDEMFAKNTPDEISGFLAAQIDAADKEGDKAALLTLLNEQIGFARDRGMKETALEGCSRLQALISELGIEGTVPHGMTLLNIANAFRVFGLYTESEELFRKIEEIYFRNIPEGSYDYAALYNNWSLLALSKGEASRAADLVVLALDVVDKYDGAIIEQATSRVNLACILMDEAESDSTGRDRLLDEASNYIDGAVRRFEAAGGNDFHFASALSARGDLLMKTGEYQQAADSYRRAVELIRLYVGNNSKTEVLERKIAAAESHL